MAWLNAGKASQSQRAPSGVSQRQSDARRSKKELDEVCGGLTPAERKAIGTESAFIHPTSAFRIFWNILTIVPGLSSIFLVPMEFAFSDERSWKMSTEMYVKITHIIFDVWLFMDIWLNFNTGYLDKVGVLGESFYFTQFLYFFIFFNFRR